MTAHRLQPTSVYAVLWLHIARVHQGEDDRKEFKENSERLQRDAWPGPLLDLYDGTKTSAQFRMAALEGDANRRERICEVESYLGQFEAYHQPGEARKLLSNAVNECPHYDINYFAAKAELESVNR